MPLVRDSTVAASSPSAAECVVDRPRPRRSRSAAGALRPLSRRRRSHAQHRERREAFESVPRPTTNRCRERARSRRPPERGASREAARAPRAARRRPSQAMQGAQGVWRRDAARSSATTDLRLGWNRRIARRRRISSSQVRARATSAARRGSRTRAGERRHHAPAPRSPRERGHQRAAAVLDGGGEIRLARHDECGRCARRWRARIGDRSAIVDVDLVPDRRYDRHPARRDRARDDLVVERPEVLDRAPAPADDHDVDGRERCELADARGDLALGTRTLNAHRTNHDA